jgi:hypothetical protein
VIAPTRGSDAAFGFCDAGRPLSVSSKWMDPDLSASVGAFLLALWLEDQA